MTLPVDLIPNLDELYEATCKYVKKHQGKKGYIDTQDEDYDQIYAIVYDGDFGCGVEARVLGVRYSEEYDTLEIAYVPILNSIRLLYQEKDFNDDENWYPVIYSDIVYYIPTLINIAEVIDEYVE